MTELTPEDVEFIRILANSDAAILQKGMDDAARQRLDERMGVILREYYRENTMGARTGWTQKLEEAGITEDDGKAAIACARRLGMDIS